MNILLSAAIFASLLLLWILKTKASCNLMVMCEVILQYSLRLWLSFFCLSLISALDSTSTTTTTQNTILPKRHCCEKNRHFWHHTGLWGHCGLWGHFCDVGTFFNITISVIPKDSDCRFRCLKNNDLNSPKHKNKKAKLRDVTETYQTGQKLFKPTTEISTAPELAASLLCLHGNWANSSW